jgi:hypothetical protein
VVRVDEDGAPRAVVDPGRSMPGRGAWLHADPHCLELAERRRALPRALRTPTLDVSDVRRAFGAGHGDPSFTEMGSGLEADGHPMSTRR